MAAIFYKRSVFRFFESFPRTAASDPVMPNRSMQYTCDMHHFKVSGSIAGPARTELLTMSADGQIVSNVKQGQSPWFRLTNMKQGPVGNQKQ